MRLSGRLERDYRMTVEGLNHESNPNMLKIISARGIIRTVRERWLSHYAHMVLSEPDRIFDLNYRTVKQIAEALQILDLETCAAADVDACIGVRGWATCNCDQCGEPSAFLVRFGENSEYATRCLDLCSNCLQQGLALLERSA